MSRSRLEVALAKGSATYGYDIPLPAGPGGFGSKVSLTYNSGFSNGLVGETTNPDTGWVGTGWVLELGQITWQTAGYNRVSRQPVFKYHLTLNGVSEELLPTDKANDLQTRHKTFMKITGPGNLTDMGQALSGQWTVVDQAGTT
jgi:hypothetical protein